MSKIKRLSLMKPVLVTILLAMVFSFVSMEGSSHGGRNTIDTSAPHARNGAGELNFQRIALSNVPQGSYHQGVIEIKLTPEAGKIVPDKIFTTDNNQHVITNHQELDELNKKFSIQKYEPLLNDIYEISDKSVARRNLHIEWGLHLWFQLTFDEDIDVIEVVRSFRKLDAIEEADPAYKRKLIEPVEIHPVEDVDPPPTRFTPNDTHYARHQWALNNTGQSIQNHAGRPGADITAEQAWEIETGHPDVIVAVIDTGIEFTHSDLAANMWEGIGPLGENTNGRHHGTHVGGTISAVTNNNRGIAGIAGGSGQGNGVSLMSCPIFGEGNFMERSVYAADQGAAISQNSWGYENPGVARPSDLNAINYFNDNAGGDVLQGGVTIFASGNSGNNGSWYPAYYDESIAVAATFNSDQKPRFSNYGPWIDIAAPGTHIISTVDGNNYGYASGTSMAAPHVSGVAALALSYAYRNGVILTNTELENIIIDSAQNIDDYNPNFVGMLGSGRVDAYSALLNVYNNYIGIFNPENFAAVTEGETEIRLTWDLNEDEDDVMIIYSREPQLGRPDRGTFYGLGHNIPGGGKVLYKGNDTSLLHDNLDAGRTYYYKAFSYDQLFEYSFGVSSEETTMPPTFNLPFAENFEDDILPACWNVRDLIGNGQVWEIGSFEGGLEGAEGNYAYINSSYYGEDDSQHADLITPAIDLSDFEDEVSLKFKHYFKTANSTNGRLFYSTNGGSNWNIMDIWTTTTDNPATYEVIMDNIAGHHEAMFKWRYFGRNAKHWSIDKIELFETVHFPPENLTAVPGEGSIELQWDAPDNDGNLSFNIYRDGNLVNHEPVVGNSYIDSGLEPKVSYSYYVTTVYDDGESIPSEKIDEEPGEIFFPPQFLSYEIKEYDIHLNWHPPQEEISVPLVGYNVYRNEEKLNMRAVRDTVYIDENLNPDEVYEYYLTAVYETKESQPTDTLRIDLVSVEDTTTPYITNLETNYPNPFNPQTTIVFSLAEPGQTTLEVYDVRGRLIATLCDEILKAGKHQIVWNGKTNQGTAAGSGIYFYRLSTGSYTATRKMIMIQ